MKAITALLCLFLTQTALIEGTVVTIHGYMQNWRSMRTQGRRLERHGFKVAYWDYATRHKTILGHAECLLPTLQSIAAANPGEPIDFVAYSLGALILRAAINLPDCPWEAKIGRAVLIAPTNQGSYLARQFRDNPMAETFLGNGAGRDLMTLDGAALRACFGDFPYSMSILVIAGYRGIHSYFFEPNDGWVMVSETELCTPYYRVLIPVSHGALLNNPCSLNYTLQFLCGGEYP